MTRVRTLLTALIPAAALVSACTPTQTIPMCRAPQAHEMEAFRAIIAHRPDLLLRASAPGPARDALQANEGMLRSWLWGSNGETRGAVISLLSTPPLCVIDDPRHFDETGQSREVLVYAQAGYDRVAAPPETLMPEIYEPYGVQMRDYMSCRFEQTGAGWKLADMCGYRGASRRVTG